MNLKSLMFAPFCLY